MARRVLRAPLVFLFCPVLVDFTSKVMSVLADGALVSVAAALVIADY
nr:DUF3927 family protein [Salmonella sp.]